MIITRIKKNKVTIDREHYDEFIRRLSATLRDPDVREAMKASGRGGCQGFCDDVCRRHGGCDVAFGDPGECGALCNDGDIILEP